METLLHFDQGALFLQAAGQSGQFQRVSAFNKGNVNLQSQIFFFLPPSHQITLQLRIQRRAPGPLLSQVGCTVDAMFILSFSRCFLTSYVPNSHQNYFLPSFSRFFTVESTAEILAEFRPLLCPSDEALFTSSAFLCALLPTKRSSQAARGEAFLAWMDEMMGYVTGKTCVCVCVCKRMCLFGFDFERKRKFFLDFVHFYFAFRCFTYF